MVNFVNMVRFYSLNQAKNTNGKKLLGQMLLNFCCGSEAAQKTKIHPID